MKKILMISGLIILALFLVACARQGGENAFTGNAKATGLPDKVAPKERIKIDSSKVDTKLPNKFCGDSIIGGTEECDQNNFAGKTCATIYGTQTNPSVLNGGELQCTTCKIDTAKCCVRQQKAKSFTCDAQNNGIGAIQDTCGNTFSEKVIDCSKTVVKTKCYMPNEVGTPGNTYNAYGYNATCYSCNNVVCEKDGLRKVESSCLKGWTQVDKITC